MDIDTDSRKVKDRSPRFPFITLEKALERAAQFFAEEKRGAAPFSSAAEHWNYSASSSGALQTVAALKSYGLLEGTHKSIRLSELALRILLDKRPDSTERDALKRQAALNPEIATLIYEKWPDDLPSDATLNHFLVLELSFNEATAQRSVEIIKQNQLFTANGLSASFDVQSLNVENTRKDEIMKDSQDVGGMTSAVSKGSRLTTSKLWIERTNDPAGLNVTLQFEGEPTEVTYQYLQDFFQFKAQQLLKTKGG